MGCVDCEDIVRFKDSIRCGGATCSTVRCKPCHNAQRALRKWYQKAERTEEWENLSSEDRKEMVKRNKHKGTGKGFKRQVLVNESASCTDSLSLKQEKPFMTKKKFLSLQTGMFFFHFDIGYPTKILLSVTFMLS